MKIKDHFLTNETFEVKESEYNDILKTYDLPYDIAKYYDSDKYLSHNKDNSLKAKIYSLIQKLNEKYKLKIIKKYKSSGKILDYGCGDGSFLQFMQSKNFSVIGFEPNKKAAKQTELKIGIKHITSSLETINDNSLDIITLWHVLEHIPNPEEILLQLKSKLKNNGYLLIAVPNHKSYDAKFYKEHWAAWDVPRHIFHYGKNGAINFFTQNKFKVIKTYPLPFDSFYISLISENYAQNSLGILRFPFIGTISNLKGLKDGNYSSVIYILNK